MSEFRLPRPLQLGINPFKPRISITEGMRAVKEKNTDVVVAQAKKTIGEITTATPSLVISSNELERFHVDDPRKLYAREVEGLADRSSHNVGHVSRVLVLATFLGNYVNEMQKGQQPLDVEALQYGAVTHDGFRRRTGIGETILDYQRHGRLAAQNLTQTLDRLGLPLPPPATLQRIQEIDRYHDVETRPVKERSREATLFTLIDKMEMVRLFHPKHLSLAHKLLGWPITSLATFRMRIYEGTDPHMKELMNIFLPVADALYRISTTNIEAQVAAQQPATRRQTQEAWRNVDQFAAVMSAAEELGMIAPKERVGQKQHAHTMVY